MYFLTKDKGKQTWLSKNKVLPELETHAKRADDLEKALAHLLKELEGKVVVPADKEVIVKIGDDLRRGKVEVFPDTDTPLTLLEVQDGKLIKSKRKVGSL